MGDAAMSKGDHTCLIKKHVKQSGKNGRRVRGKIWGLVSIFGSAQCRGKDFSTGRTGGTLICANGWKAG